MRVALVMTHLITCAKCVVTFQEALPILYIPAPHSPHFPRVAGRPFFIVTCSVSCISRLSLHFMQYAVIVSSLHSLSC